MYEMEIKYQLHHFSIVILKNKFFQENKISTTLHFILYLQQNN